MINGPGKYSVNIATPGVTIRGTDGAPPVRCMMALAEQISGLDSIVIYGRVVGVRGLVMERAMPSGRYPAVNVLQPVSGTMPRAADQAYLPVLTRARQVMAIYADMEEHSARTLSCRDRPRGRRGYPAAQAARSFSCPR
jgi:hypothetical protein